MLVSFCNLAHHLKRRTSKNESRKTIFNFEVFYCIKFIFQIIRVCQTDCIRVQNLKKGAKEYAIKLALMNKRLTQGQVTSVQFSDASHKTAFVHYANFAGELSSISVRSCLQILCLPVDTKRVTVVLVFHHV